MVRVALALPALTVALACGACHHAAPTPPPSSGGDAPVDAGATAPDAGGETVVKVEDDGKTVEVKAGATVAFELAGNSGTGYAWKAAPVDAAVLEPKGERTVERLSDVPGGAKLDVLRFVAKGPGTVVVQLDLERPWGNQPVVRTVKVTVTVR